jgi:hypothetical protein
MADTEQIEEIAPDYQKNCWRLFQQFLAAELNRKYAVDCGVPLPAIKNSNQDGWSTSTAGLPVFDAKDIEDESNETDAPEDHVLNDDEAKHRLYLRLIFALLGNSTNVAAAAEVGISIRVLYRWRKLPEFIALYEKTKRELYNAACTNMKSVLIKAGVTGAKVLEHIATDKAAADTARVQAAKALTALVLQIESVESIESRVAELEKAGATGHEDSGTFTTIKKAVS